MSARRIPPVLNTLRISTCYAWTTGHRGRSEGLEPLPWYSDPFSPGKALRMAHMAARGTFYRLSRSILRVFREFGKALDARRLTW